MNRPVSLPALPRVSYRRQTFSELLLLALGFFLLVRLARLLFRARTRRSTTDQCQKERRNQNRRGEQLLHTEIRNDNRRDQRGNRQRCFRSRQAGSFNFGDVVFVYCLLAVLMFEGS
jgi:hypothetical protein